MTSKRQTKVSESKQERQLHLEKNPAGNQKEPYMTLEGVTIINNSDYISLIGLPNRVPQSG